MDEVFIPIFIYQDAKEKYKYNGNFQKELREYENLMKADLKNDVIEIERIGSKYVTIRHYDTYMLNLCPFVSKRKIQIQRCHLYLNNYNCDIKKLQLEKPYSISRIVPKKPLISFDTNVVDYFAVINLKPTSIPTLVINNCSVCFEDNQLAVENGYFKCSHKDCICNNCFDCLPRKICPLCRSN